MEADRDDTQEKQILLKTKILDQNYDKMQFINFCLSKKENGDDINSWTLSELNDIVSEFMDKSTPKNESAQQNQQEEETKVQDGKTKENSDETLAKQNLLREEISKKNYDQTSFVNYCLTKKENGDDLNNWTLEELKMIVKEFINAQSKNKTEDEQKNQLKQSSNDNEHDDIKTIEKMDNFISDDSKNAKERTIECKKLAKTKLNDTKLDIEICNPKEISGGVFGKNHTIYEVKTKQFNWSVSRRYSDFETLRKLIVKHNPFIYVPPLPDKQLANKKLDKDVNEKRMKFLNYFIHHLVESEVFKASEILYVFLSYTDRGKFESRFKEYSSQQPSSYVEEYKTFDGKLTISLDQEKEKYFINISKYFKVQGKILDSLNNNFKSLYENMNMVCENLKDIQKCYEILYKLSMKALIKKQITKTYEELTRFFENFRNVAIKQNELIKSNMKDFFEYIYLEGSSYMELIDSREELKSRYNSENQRITTKKEKLYSLKDVSKYELGDAINIDKNKLIHDKVYAFEHMCKNETANLSKIRNQLGYANKMSMTELKKLIKEYCIRYIDNLKKFVEGFNPLTDTLVGLSGNLKNFIESSSNSQPPK